MSLGTTDADGVWVSDVIYVHDDELNIYWVSLPSARHSQAIEVNPAVAGTITASWDLGKERALQFSGTAMRFEGAHLDLEQKLESKRGKEVPKVAGEILAKGHGWYVLKPQATKVIHGELFGYERKSLVVDTV